MADPLTPSALRKDIYNVLDEVLESGEPRQIRRRGKTLWLVAGRPPRSFRIGEGPQHPDVYDGTIEELAAVSWEHLWAPDPVTEPQ